MMDYRLLPLLLAMTLSAYYAYQGRPILDLIVVVLFGVGFTVSLYNREIEGVIGSDTAAQALVVGGQALFVGIGLIYLYLRYRE